MSDNDFSDLGREIGSKIDKFVNSKEIKDLQDNIKITVEKTMGEVQRATKEANDQWKCYSESHQSTYQSPYAPNSAKSEVRSRAQQRQLPVERRPQGKVSGVLLTVFGSIGSVVGWSASLISWLIYALGEAVIGMAIGTAAISISLTGAIFFTGMAIVGGFLRKRANRFLSYVKTMGIKDFYSIEGLAETTKKSEKFVAKDIGKMIKRGWFKEGHLDDKETCFMLTDEAYQLYLDAESELKRKQEEEDSRKREQELIEQDPVKKQLKIAVEEGKEYVKRIRAANDEIPGEEISKKLDRLEAIGTKIFEYVEVNPEKVQDIRKFMNYYLPTTLKLVESYQEFSNQPVQGENIISAQREIEGMLDDINKAFEKMFDKLFENDAMDISTDISVLSTMLAQEGLLEDQFK